MEITKCNKLIFKVGMSNEIDGKYKEDFINVCRHVFGEHSMDRLLFDRKFIDNIYGESILVIVYDNNKPVAARALWRNDLNRIKAYQPVNTAVLKEYRERGIFKEMTCIALDNTGSKDIIYNFPNQNSYNLYLKLGWEKYASYYTSILTSVKKYKEEHPEIIDDNYLQWWLKPKIQKYFVYYKGSDVFLVKKKKVLIRKKRLAINFVIGRIVPEQAKYFQLLKTKVPLLFYNGSKKKIYNKNRLPLNIVYKSVMPIDNLQIPVYKMDAI